MEIESLMEKVKAHEAKLDALANVPSLLSQVAKSLGVKSDEASSSKVNPGVWSLGLSDEEEESPLSPGNEGQAFADMFMDVDKEPIPGRIIKKLSSN